MADACSGDSDSLRYSESRGPHMSTPSTTAVTVYDETFELPELTKWLSKVADQGYIVIPEWLTKERALSLIHI